MLCREKNNQPIPSPVSRVQGATIVGVGVVGVAVGGVAAGNKSKKKISR